MVTEVLSHINTGSAASFRCPAQIHELLRKIKVLRLNKPETKPYKSAGR